MEVRITLAVIGDGRKDFSISINLNAVLRCTALLCVQTVKHEKEQRIAIAYNIAKEAVGTSAVQGLPVVAASN